MLQKIKMVGFRSVIESLFNCNCDIYEYKDYKIGNVVKKRLSLIKGNIPCRRSYSTGANINYAKTGVPNTDNVDIKQFVKLFLPVETVIKPGSFVRVEHNNIYEYYEYSGHSLLYDSHTEVMLRSVERWA